MLSRATPSDKYALIVGLRELGAIVAATGEGNSDAVALETADIGFSLGIGGCEVAKEACDMIILDDNFVATIYSVMWGRNMIMNIRKFLQFQATVNVTCLLTVFVCGLTLSESPF